MGRYVMMPEHVHLFVCGGEDFNPGLWMRGPKRAITAALEAEPPGTAAATTPRFKAPLWQRGFFDHLLRNSESYVEKWEYVRQNPVRAGLVTRWEEWLYQGEIVTIDRV
jgi:putative transposase